MNSPEPTSIQKQANDWLLKLETDDMKIGDEERFVAWLEQDDAHAQAFHEAEHTWQLMHQAQTAELENSTANGPISQPSSLSVEHNNIIQLNPEKARAAVVENVNHSRKHGLLTILMPMAATLLVAVLSVFWWQEAWFAATTDHYTFTGERKEQTLPDGTVITLNTQSAINIQYSQHERLIELVSGEIYVDVFPDPDRPLVVQAGDMQVTALGTEFMLRREAGVDPVVSVTEHKVKVESLSSNDTQMILNEGQQVALLEKRKALTNVEQISTQNVQLWRNGKLVFRQEPLQAVVSELNRYTDKKIIIKNKNLQKIRVTGVLNIDAPIQSLSNLTAQLDLGMSSMTPFVIYIDKEPSFEN